MKKVLLLGYSNKETNLYKRIRDSFKKKILIKNYKKKPNLNLFKKYDLIISYGYKYKIENEILKKLKTDILNLHISYLPYNKGAHPNFWSFVENTTKGVTIHKINNVIDGGNIIYQKSIDFNYIENSKLNFSETYKILRKNIENLLIENFNNIIEKKYIEYPQIGLGTYHAKDELPREILKNWDQNIYRTIKKYKTINDKKNKNYFKILNQVQQTRKNNNINWMNIIKTCMQLSPKKTIKILKDIEKDDKEINNLFKKLLNEKK